MSKKQQQADAARLRKAARYYERGGDGSSTYYPCFAVCDQDPLHGDYRNRGTLANRFIRAAAPGKHDPQLEGVETSDAASDKFLNRVNLDTERGRDHCILALCFAAAMAETGDLP